jgi:hypothetical protein
MTYEAEVQFKFDATWTPSYSSSFSDDEFVPEEHYLITAPAADLNIKQYFKLFEKFMLCVGMSPENIRSGAMSLVFNDSVREEDQRKVCKEYELTMDEDLDSKFKEWKVRDEEIARLTNAPKGPMGTVLHSDEECMNHQSWAERYWQLYHRFKGFSKYTDNDLVKMRTMYDTLYSEDVDSANGVA